MKFCGPPQQVKVDHAFRIGIQDELPPIGALRYMMRNIHRYHTSQSSHGSSTNRKRPACPRFPGLSRFIRLSSAYQAMRKSRQKKTKK